MYCIKIGLLIVMTIALAIVGAIASNWVPFASTVTGLVSFGMWIWWLAGWFMECKTEYSLTGVKRL